jgi:hypothetical protein
LPKARWEFEGQIFSAADWDQLRKHITPRGWGKVYIRTRTNQISGTGYEFEDFIAIMREPEGTPHPPWGFSEVAVDFESLRPVTAEEDIFKDHFEDGEVNPALWVKTEVGAAEIEERIGNSFVRFKPRGGTGTMLRGAIPVNPVVRIDSACIEARFRYLYKTKVAEPARRFDVLRMITDRTGVDLPCSGVQLDPYSGDLYVYQYDKLGVLKWWDKSSQTWESTMTTWFNIDPDRWYVVRFSCDATYWMYHLVDPDGVTLGVTFGIPLFTQWWQTRGSVSEIIAAMGSLDTGRSWIDFDFCKGFAPFRTYEDDPENLP